MRLTTAIGLALGVEGEGPGAVPGLRAGRLLHPAHSAKGEVSELVDEHDLGSCAERRRSSSLLFPTKVHLAVPFGRHQ